MTKAIYAIISMALLLLSGCSKQETITQQIINPEISGSTEDTGTFQIVKVVLSRRGIKPDPIMLKQGQETTIEVTALDVPFGFSAQDLSAYIVRVDPGDVRRLRIVPQKTGIFIATECETSCGDPKNKKITGEIIVE